MFADAYAYVSVYEPTVCECECISEIKGVQGCIRV